MFEKSALYGLAAAAVLLCGCEKAAPKKEASLPLVYVAPAEERELEHAASVIGTVTAVDSVDLVARVEGYLEKTCFTDGSRVKAGQELFIIEPDQYQAQVDRAEAQLASDNASCMRSKTDYERQEELYQSKAVSQRERDFAYASWKTDEAAVAKAAAELKTAELDLSYTKIICPFDGLIGFSRYSDGSLVGPSSGTLATVVRTDPMYVDFSISELDLLTLKRYAQNDKDNLRVSIRFQDDTPYPLPGKIAAADNEVSGTTGTIKLRAEFPNPDNTLLPGMYVRVVIQPAEGQKALMVPTVALNSDIAGEYVFCVDADGKVQRRDLKIGLTDGSWTVVRSGLEAGDMVVTSGVQKTRAGGSVDAKPDPAFAAAETSEPATAAPAEKKEAEE